MPRKAKTKAKSKKKSATKRAPARKKATARKKAAAKKPAKKATRRKTTRKPAKKAVEMLLVGSKVRAAVKDADCNFAGDALEGLNGWVHWLVGQATKRAAANGRKTVRAHDFMIM